MRSWITEFASKFAAYSCMVIGLPLAFALYRNEPLTYIAMAAGFSLFGGGWYWLTRLRRKYD